MIQIPLTHCTMEACTHSNSHCKLAFNPHFHHEGIHFTYAVFHILAPSDLIWLM